MGFYSPYFAVFDAVKDAIETKSSIKTVLLGEQFTLGNLPKAVINAELSVFSQADIGEDLEVRVGFSVILVIRDYAPADWFTDIITVMADVVDAILADRRLAGTVLDCIPTSFVPGEIRFEDKLLFGGIIRFEAKMFYAP
jgi:hypothetical protein